MVIGNMMDISFLTDHFYKEPITFPETNEDPKKCKKFMRSALTQVISSVNDDIRRKKMINGRNVENLCDV